MLLQTADTPDKIKIGFHPEEEWPIVLDRADDGYMLMAASANRTSRLIRTEGATAVALASPILSDGLVKVTWNVPEIQRVRTGMMYSLLETAAARGVSVTNLTDDPATQLYDGLWAAETRLRTDYYAATGEPYPSPQIEYIEKMDF